MAARAGIALAAAWFCLDATSVAFAKSKKHKQHEKKSHHRNHRGEDEATGPEAGKAHLKRANALADKGDCQSAIDEYTKAYELLNDPVVLFNRGECFRQVGDADPAIDDYCEFLEKVPNAPNRASIEEKIAALEAPAGRKPPATAAKAPPPPPPAKTPPPPPPARTPPPPPATAAKTPPPPPPATAAKTPPPPPPVKTPPPPPPAKTSPPPPPATAAKMPPPQNPAEVQPPPPPPPEVVVTSPPALPPRPEAAPAPPVVARRAPPPAEATSSGGTRPWVWVALSVLAVGAGVGGFLLFRPHDQTPPDTALGNYRF